MVDEKSQEALLNLCQEAVLSRMIPCGLHLRHHRLPSCRVIVRCVQTVDFCDCDCDCDCLFYYHSLPSWPDNKESFEEEWCPEDEKLISHCIFKK